MTYVELKTLALAHKAQILTVVACGVMFVVGFGTGKATKPPEKSTDKLDYIDYTTNQEEKPTSTVPSNNEKEIKTPTKPVDPNQPCVIKGNISGSNKIYHVKGGASYEKTTPEQCFNTEAEAEAAGFRKAKR